MSSWTSHTEAFRERFNVITVDLLGHGGSDAPLDPSRYRMERTVEDLVALFDRLNLNRVNLLGYSMGGRIGLSLAINYPERLNTLILEGASPGIADPVARQDRIRSDEALAVLLEQSGIEAFVEHWLKLPIFATQARLPDSVRADVRERRLRNKPIGLANTLRGLSTGLQPPLWDFLHDVNIPTLLIAGELDRKYAGIVRDMSKTMPNAQVEIVPDAGHTVHLEQPAAFDRLVIDFLTQHSVIYTKGN